jgi:hypothetical protein
MGHLPSTFWKPAENPLRTRWTAAGHGEGDVLNSTRRPASADHLPSTFRPPSVHLPCAFRAPSARVASTPTPVCLENPTQRPSQKGLEPPASVRRAPAVCCVSADANETRVQRRLRLSSAKVSQGQPRNEAHAERTLSAGWAPAGSPPHTIWGSALNSARRSRSLSAC